MSVFDNIEELFQSIREYSDQSKSLITLATGIGVLFALYLFLKIIYGTYRLIYLYFCTQFCCKSDFKSKYGKWAIVTGATDGIGLAFAKQLAKRGHSIIIVSRNEERLANTKSELDQIANVGETLTIQADLSDPSTENFDRIRSLIDPENREIGILINNVGICPTTTQRIHRFDDNDLKTIVNLNILATVLFTKTIIPGMLKRQKGLIINVSSLLGIMPCPYMHLYPATKSFINTFTKCLQSEFAQDPIDIINLTPGAVHTKLSTEISNHYINQNVNPLSPTPDDWAASSLNAVSAGFSSYSGTFAHDFFESVVTLPIIFGIFFKTYKPLLKIYGKDYRVSPTFRRKSYVHPEQTTTQPAQQLTQSHQ